MPENVKELIVVLAISLAIFRLAKPIALRFSAESDFARRRNIWFALTITAFLVPSFWLFVLVAMPLFVWAGRKDSNPVAFYLLMFHVVPDIPIDIPTIGIQQLFWLDNYRLLSFCVLVPVAWRLRRAKQMGPKRTMTSMDFLLLGYGLVQIVLYVPEYLPGQLLPPDSATNLLRRAFLFFIDVYILYYVVSRSCSTRRAIVEAQATLCLACAVMAAQAIFEVLRHWLLYTNMTVRWETLGLAGFYYVREGVARAQAAAGHPLALGYLLAIATGFWLYLPSITPSKRGRIAVTLLFWGGLLATFSRGPWLGAVAIYLTFTAIGPRALPRMLKATAIVVLIVAALSLTPFGERLIDSLPFFGGTADRGSVVYRQNLATEAWTLIQQHPYFGDQLALPKMEALRQGEGIIDLVNTYAQVGLFYGLIGLSLFVGFILVGFVKSYRLAKNAAKSDPDLALLGASLSACIIGNLLMIWNCSFILGVEKMYYVLGGLTAAYLHLGASAERSHTNAILSAPREAS
jgi:O-antigen ligase